MIKELLQTKSKEKGDELKYSQSRIYLFICMGLILLITLGQLALEIEIDKINIAIDTLFNLILIFSVYALGEKSLNGIKDIFK